jgi:WD40 repeat protein
VACTALDGVPVIITGSWDETVRIWDLRTRQPLGEPLTGHTGRVEAIACTTLGGVPTAVIASWDATVRIWNLHTRECVALLHLSDPHAVAFTTDGDLLVGFHQDIAVFRRQPDVEGCGSGSRDGLSWEALRGVW